MASLSLAADTKRRMRSWGSPSPDSWSSWLKDKEDPVKWEKYKTTDPLGSFLKEGVLPMAGMALAAPALSSLGAIGGGTTSAGNTVIGSSLTAPSLSSGGVGGFIGNALKGVTWENALKLLKDPMVSGYILQQLFPNPANKRIGQLQNQMDASRAASLRAIQNMGMGPGVASGGNASRMWGAQAGSGTTGGTMAGVNGGYVQNALSRAREDLTARQESARSGVESGYYSNAMNLEGYRAKSNAEYARTLGELGKLFGWG